tara:strand:- start:68 stop:514 length:447 start_codon:yes stop_codon:yes gene_type:complete
MELPFPLYKRHKYFTFNNWDKYGIIFESKEHREEIYQQYIYSKYCELCGKEFPNTRDRCMDHDHITGEVRNIVCTKCNLQKKDNKRRPTNTDEKYIYKCKDKRMKQGFYYAIEIRRDCKKILATKRNTLEKAIICRDEFIKENPWIYS